jgi:hypothetical protein
LRELDAVSCLSDCQAYAARNSVPFRSERVPGYILEQQRDAKKVVKRLKKQDRREAKKQVKAMRATVVRS